jgi:hypothetical protein
MEFSIAWLYVFAIIGGLIAGWRIWQNLRKLRQRFPNPDGAQQLATQLRSEGFEADMKDSPENGDLRYSLHVRKSMQLTVPDMQSLSRRLTDAAIALGGRYDGWSAQQDPAPR